MQNKRKLHSRIFTKSTLDIVRGSKQHVYDDAGVQYLDCVNGTSHVGHCHPQVKFMILYYIIYFLHYYITLHCTGGGRGPPADVAAGDLAGPHLGPPLQVCDLADVTLSIHYI